MEHIYRRHNFLSSRGIGIKRRPGRPPANVNVPIVKCFVCDVNIQKKKVNLILGPSNSKFGFAHQISQLIGDEFMVIVKEDDYLCKRCVNLFNSMDKLEKELESVKSLLLGYVKVKYDLSNNASDNCKKDDSANNLDDDDDDDEIAKKLNDLHTGEDRLMRCNVCSYSTKDQINFDIHIRDHIKIAIRAEEAETENANKPSNPPVKLFQCEVCSKLYTSRESCLSHMTFSHLPNRGEVIVGKVNNKPICCNGLNGSDKDDRLAKETHSKHLYQCHTCHTSFKNENRLSEHQCTPIGDVGRQHNLALSEVDMNLANKLVQMQQNNNNDLMDFERGSCSSLNKQGSVTNYRNTDHISDSEKENSPQGSESSSEESESEDHEDEMNNKKYQCSNCGFQSSLINLREHLSEIRLQRDLICSICGQSFNSFCKLMKHSLGHDINSKRVECLHCCIEVPDRLSLDFHMKKKHLNLIDHKACDECGIVFPNHLFLEKHERLEHGNAETDSVLEQDAIPNVEENHDAVFQGAKHKDATRTLDHEPTENMDVVYDCGICGDQRSKEEELLAHFEMHANEFVCEVCNINFSDRTRLLRHKLSHNLQPVETMCLYCNKKLFDRLHLRYHIMYNHTNTIRRNYCRLCKKTFYSLKCLNLHIIKEHKFNLIDYRCKKCDRAFKSKFQLCQHYSYAHRVEQKCRFCKKVLGSPRALYKHELSHKRKSMNLQCDVCRKFYKTEADLRFHKIKHKVSFSYCCEVCEVSFTSASALDAHMKSHAVESIHRCSVCSGTFESYASYESHRLRHERYSPYGCNLCNQKFHSLLTRKMHKLKSHKEQFPLKCKFCSSVFIANSVNVLKRHLYNHVKNLPYFCKFCLRDFTTRQKLGQHLARIHKTNTAFPYRNRKTMSIFENDNVSVKANVISETGDFNSEIKTNENVLSVSNDLVT